MYSISTILGVLFAIALVLFLVLSNVRWAFTSTALYEFGFARYDVTSTTGLTPTQLSEAAQQIRDYFNSPTKLLDVRVSVNGAKRELYNDREVHHMLDVKDLLKKIYRVQEGAFFYLMLFVTTGFFTMGNNFSSRLRRFFLVGSLLTIGLVAVLGLASLVGFEQLFVLFHEISFSNNLWQLDPNSSYLLRMFPQSFWLEATMLIGLVSMVEALAIIILLAILTWWQHWRQRVAQRKIPRYV